LGFGVAASTTSSLADIPFVNVRSGFGFNAASLASPEHSAVSLILFLSIKMPQSNEAGLFLLSGKIELVGQVDQHYDHDLSHLSVENIL
jgi:hypothetical protein